MSAEKNGRGEVAAVVEAAENLLVHVQQMPVQLYDERGASMGFSTYGAAEMPYFDALVVAINALHKNGRGGE